MLGYLKLQAHFTAVALREKFSDVDAALGVVPSPRLRHRVHGSTDIRGYLDVGRACWKNLRDLLAESGADAGSFRSILDFGCGSGRVIRNIPTTDKDGGAVNVCGADVDERAIHWCAKHLRGYHFSTVAPQPPTPFPDAAFDFIFAISVFSHLDEEMQFASLGEMKRLLRPGGFFIASVHGDYHRSLAGRASRHDMRRGFVFTATSKGAFKKDGLPDFYQDAQHTRDYVEREWSRYFRIVRYAERGIAAHQDAVVMTTR